MGLESNQRRISLTALPEHHILSLICSSLPPSPLITCHTTRPAVIRAPTCRRARPLTSHPQSFRRLATHAPLSVLHPRGTKKEILSTSQSTRALKGFRLEENNTHYLLYLFPFFLSPPSFFFPIPPPSTTLHSLRIPQHVCLCIAEEPCRPAFIPEEARKS